MYIRYIGPFVSSKKVSGDTAHFHTTFVCEYAYTVSSQSLNSLCTHVNVMLVSVYELYM